MRSDKTFEIKVEPAVMDWAVKSSGWSVENLAKRIKISEGTLHNWLNGTLNPNLRQLETLSGVIKRPLAAFLLLTPPAEKPLPKDYRMLPEKEGKFDKKTIFAIRRARRLQNISKELLENLNATMVSTIPNFPISNNPLELADKYRTEFKLTIEQQAKLKTPYELLNLLRDIIEDKNILVFQISMHIEDARGFAIADETPAIIVVNSKDQIEARIFSLMHEFGHIILKESGISLPENALIEKSPEPVEKWCNEFASAFLLPKSVAKSIFDENKATLTETKTLDKLSRKYKLSKAMILYNMLKLEYISYVEYGRTLERYKPKPIEAKKAKIFAPSADKKCLSEKGQKFVSLVINNMEKGLITHSEALGYLSLKSRNLEKVASKAKK